MSFFIPFTTEGQMNVSDIKKECQSEGWIPLLYYEFEDKKVIPIFKNSDICRKFLKRNLPKDHLTGAVELTPDDQKQLDESEYEFKYFDHPRKISDWVKFNVYIYNFTTNPELTTA